MAKRTRLGLEIEAGLKEVRAHRKGEICLAGRALKTSQPAVRLIEKAEDVPKKRGPYKKKVAV
jgi:hypothetical protein